MDAVTSAIAAPNTARSATKSSSGLSSDFETFLVMLTTQMQNQDPLNPMESSDFAVQLATFSGVEQQVKTNDLLSGLGTQIDVMNLGQLAGWVGMEARSSAPVRFEGSPLTLFPTVPNTADRAELIVSDDSGKVIQRLDFNPGSQEITWAGVDDAGVPLPDGTYQFVVQPFAGGALLDMQAVEAFSMIKEVRTDGDEIGLILQGDIEQSAQSITALRTPEAP